MIANGQASFCLLANTVIACLDNSIERFLMDKTHSAHIWRMLSTVRQSFRPGKLI